MDPLTTAQTKLSKADFRTWQKPTETNRVYFKDRSVFGMITIYESVSELLGNWEDRQDEFLQSNRNALRSSGNQEKVWNAYTIHLTISDFSDDHGKPDQENELFRVEEDFRGTRKIARTGVTNEKDITSALLPLLPIQRRPQLAAEDYRQQLEQELGEEFDEAFLGVLNEDISIDRIMNDLLKGQ